MISRLAQLLLRLVGWIMTPLVVIAAAALGATVAALPAPRLGIRTGLIVAAIGGLIGASLGFWGWLQLLSRSPELRDVLHVTSEGVPTEAAASESVDSDPISKPDTPEG